MSIIDSISISCKERFRSLYNNPTASLSTHQEMPLAQSDSQIASSSSNTELGRRVRILSHGSIERSEQEESMLGKHRRTEEKDVKSDLESDSHNVKKSRESSSSFFIQDATPPGFQVGSLSNIRPTATPNVSKSASRENSPKR